MSTIKAKAYLPSVKDITTISKKFPAFISSLMSDNAQEQRVTRIAKLATIIDKTEAKRDVKQHHMGQYFLRTPYFSDSVVAVEKGGTKIVNPSAEAEGLRVGISIVYNPDSAAAKSCRMITRTVVWSYGRFENKETSTAPIITFAGKEYVWINKEECESGKAQVMSCISLDLLAKAEPYYKEEKKKVLFFHVSKDKSVRHNDYAKAEELRAQCERVAFENASEEEKAMVVEVEMSSQDLYEDLTYHFTEKQKQLIDNEPEIEL